MEKGEGKKQDVTQHAELGRATFDSDAKRSLKNSDSSFELNKHRFQHVAEAAVADATCSVGSRTLKINIKTQQTQVNI